MMLMINISVTMQLCSGIPPPTSSPHDKHNIRKISKWTFDF